MSKPFLADTKFQEALLNVPSAELAPFLEVIRAGLVFLVSGCSAEVTTAFIQAFLSPSEQLRLFMLFKGPSHSDVAIPSSYLLVQSESAPAPSPQNPTEEFLSQVFAAGDDSPSPMVAMHLRTERGNVSTPPVPPVAAASTASTAAAQASSAASSIASAFEPHHSVAASISGSPPLHVPTVSVPGAIASSVAAPETSLVSAVPDTISSRAPATATKRKSSTLDSSYRRQTRRKGERPTLARSERAARLPIDDEEDGSVSSATGHEHEDLVLSPPCQLERRLTMEQLHLKLCSVSIPHYRPVLPALPQDDLEAVERVDLLISAYKSLVKADPCTRLHTASEIGRLFARAWDLTHSSQRLRRSRSWVQFVKNLNGPCARTVRRYRDFGRLTSQYPGILSCPVAFKSFEDYSGSYHRWLESHAQEAVIWKRSKL